MANEESNKLSSSPKVPPLKIVFSSHHNNAVVNVSSIDDDQFKSNERVDITNDNLEHKELGRRNSVDINDGCEKNHKKNPKISCDRAEPETSQLSNKTAGFSSSSSSSSTSDRSTSTTPSSESESLASNSTIITENQQVKNKTARKDETSVVKQYRVFKDARIITTEKSNVNTSLPGKKSQESSSEQTSDHNSTSYKEQSLNANQRITRSSQRAAQQSKSENMRETNVDDLNVSENQEKIHESARKVKRRKGEPQENDQDGPQTIAQPAVTMANIYPSDYQLPSQNSFELYRDIRKRPYKKLMKLSHVQPRVPHGFKDYLLNGGPYLLDGNKLGAGMSGSKLNSSNNNDLVKNGVNFNSRIPLRLKLSNPQKLPSHHSSQLRHTLYAIPKVSDVPKNLQVGSPLYELFLDQEKARQQMRMQHLKERERSILTAEQEILRTYNRAAIADVRQKLHLSACTYFYYQERYHYSDEKAGLSASIKEVPHSQDNSFLCIEGGDATKSLDNNIPANKETRSLYSESSNHTEEKSVEKDENKPEVDSSTSHSSNLETKKAQSSIELVGFSEGVKIINLAEDVESGVVQKNISQESNIMKSDMSDDGCVKDVIQNSNFKTTTDASAPIKDVEGKELGSSNNQIKNLDLDSDNSISDSTNGKQDSIKGMSDEECRILNKETFVNQLQEIDDKWDKIKMDMLVRHKNEADSLQAVQSLEWEWKAKEIGACDVRVSLKIESEFVPRVEISPLDY